MLVNGINLSDVGRANVTIDDVTRQVDICDNFNRLVELYATTGKDARAYTVGVIALLTELGFPEVSHWTATQFSDAVIARMKELRGELGNAELGETKPVSPVSTEESAILSS